MFDPLVSGTKNDRHGLQRLLEDAKDGVIHKVVVFDLSRLSRDMLKLLNVINDLTSYGISIETPKEGAIGFDGSIQQFLIAAKALVATEEREAISRRTKEALAERRSNGIRLGRPKGRKKNKSGWRKDYLKSEPKLVENILYHYGKGNSSHTIAESLSNSGLQCSQSKVSKIIRMYKGDI